MRYNASDGRYETPQALWDELDLEFGFTLDVCALPENAKCAEFYSPELDGLKQDWQGVCWCNPPYSGIEAWVRKAYLSSLAGATVVMLLPARTESAWWHDYCLDREVRWLRGRLRFGGMRNSAPFPSVLVVFRP